MSGSQIDTGLELDESPLDSVTTALQTGTLGVDGGEGGLEVDPLDVVGDVVAPEWAPSLEDIAAEVPAYTKGRVLGGGQSAGERQLTFSDTTKPTAQEVEGFIVGAVNEIAGRVGCSLTRLAEFPDLARTTTVWAVVMRIVRDPEERQTAERQYVGCLNDLKGRASRVTPGLL